MGAQQDDTEDKPLDLGVIRQRLLKDKAQLEHDLAIKDEEASEQGDDLIRSAGAWATTWQTKPTTRPSRKRQWPCRTRPNRR